MEKSSHSITSRKWKKKDYRKEQRRRHRELNDLLDECYGIIIAKSVIKISKEKCSGCKIDFFQTHPLLHTCKLPNDIKVKEFGEEAITLAYDTNEFMYKFRKYAGEKFYDYSDILNFLL